MPTFLSNAKPAALLREHALAPGRWGVLQVLSGGTWFVDLALGQEHQVEAPGGVTIEPGTPHKLRLEGPLRCRIDFFASS